MNADKTGTFVLIGVHRRLSAVAFVLFPEML
jgi:hypothetical protein